MKIRPVGAELLHVDGRTDRRTDMTNLIVAFRNFANACKKTILKAGLDSAFGIGTCFELGGQGVETRGGGGEIIRTRPDRH